MSRHYVTDLINGITSRLAIEYRNERTAHANAWTLLQQLTGHSQAQLFVAETIELSHEQTDTLNQWVTQITQEHKPIQYILGSVAFLDVEIHVEPPVVIPRPETETWCHELITQLKAHDITQFRCIDMCTGTGCVAIAIAHAFPQATVYAADISEQALQLAHTNAQYNNVTIHTIQSNVFEQIPCDMACDIIVANPPYITRDEWSDVRQRITQWEDPQALVAADDGLSIIQDIISSAPQHLVPWHHNIPHLWVEIGYLQGAHVAQLCIDHGFTNVTTHHDLAGHDRWVTGHAPE